MTKLNTKQWTAKLKRLGDRAAGAIQRGLVAGGQRCVALMQTRGDNAVPASAHGQRGAFSSGQYRRLWRFDLVPRGVRVYNVAPYASVIDEGRRIGAFPPLRVIQQWAQRKLGLSAKEAKRAAYPIARAIARRGLRPRRVLSGGNDKMRKIISAEVKRELEAELRR